MNIDLGSFAYGSILSNGVGTPSWGTALGQSSPNYYLTKEGCDRLIMGMAYCSVPLETVSLPFGRGGRVLNCHEAGVVQIASVFKKVYVNNELIKQPFIMVLLKEESDSHFGRRSVKYAEKTAFENSKTSFSNLDFKNAVYKHFGLSVDACWFVYDIDVANYEELHLQAVFVDKKKSVGYSDSQTRSRVWIQMINKAVEENGSNKAGQKYTSFTPSPSQSDIISAHQSLLLALRTKPFVLLAGISGTGKSRIVRELAFASCPERLQDEDGTTPGNYCMVEVKPNWHDSTELLGYYSSVSKKYYLTKFIHFLYKASLDENKNVPFFVCLDEMNLAPVEQYFAEFLSVLETRKFANNHIVTEQLIKKEEFEKCELPEEDDTVGNTRVQLVSDIKYSSKELEIIKHLKENGLALPENVFVIGTVNMDDTTHQFSRKVIDRAMTIEMNGGKLMDMFGGSKKLAYVPDPLPLSAFLPKYVTADEVIEAHRNSEVQIKNITVELLDALNNTLKNTPFQISYRVLNELVIYLGNILDDKCYDGDGSDDDFKAYVAESFANIVMMKVLPRIEGDQELLGDKLDKIKGLSADTKYNTKLQEMIDRLEDQSFTRFWA